MLTLDMVIIERKGSFYIQRAERFGAWFAEHLHNEFQEQTKESKGTRISS